MLPGKKYSPEDLLRVAWKRRWVVAIPLVVIASTTAVVALFLPNRYRATTSVMIVPQRVPEKFVESTVKDDLGDRLNMISQQIRAGRDSSASSRSSTCIRASASA